MQESQFVGLGLLAIVGLVFWFAFRRASGVNPLSETPQPSDQGGQPNESGGWGN